MAKYRIAIIGYGKIAQDQQAPAIHASPADSDGSQPGLPT